MNKKVIIAQSVLNGSSASTGKALAFIWKFITFTIFFAASCVAFSLFSHKVNEQIENVQTDALSNIDIRFPLHTIVIDAGHGGVDGGAVSDDGLLEKEINLSIANHLEKLLRMSGIEVVMTRKDDSELISEFHTGSRKRADLLERVKIAQSTPNALFISIHQNKFPIEKYHGLQVYYSKNNPQSKLLAESVRATNVKLLQPENTRESKDSGSSILILNKIEIPAVLVECGFLSNKYEAQLLSDDRYRRKLAFVIFCSIFNYIDNRHCLS